MSRKILILVNKDATLYNARKEFVAAMVRHGFVVVISTPRSDYTPRFEELGCRILETPVNARGINPFKDLSLLRRYRAMMKSERPDLVLTYTIKPNVYGGWMAGRLKIPVLATITGLGTAVQNPGPLQKITRFLYTRGLKRVEKVFFQNNGNRELLLQAGAVLPEQVVMVSGSGVNLEHFRAEPFPPDDGTVRILLIARLMKDKGVEEFATATRRIKAKYPQVFFEVLGGYEDRYETLLDQLSAEKIITYHGYQTDIRPYLKNAHAVVLPSYHEGMANVLLEAAATGRAVLASNIPGCRETFDEGVTGIGFSPKSADDLYRAIEEFVLLPDAKKRGMGLAGRQKMEHEFDRNKVIDTYFREIDRVLPKTVFLKTKGGEIDPSSNSPNGATDSMEEK